MEITGVDNVIFTTRSNVEIARAFLAALRSKWPEPRIDVALDAMTMDYTRLGLDALEGIFASLLPDQQLELYLLRDEKMRTHFESHGYAPDENGEGPCALLIGSRRGLRLKATAVSEEIAPDRKGTIRPYPAWICGEVREVSMVTPDDPAMHEFSRWLLEIALVACTG